MKSEEGQRCANLGILAENALKNLQRCIIFKRNTIA